MIKKIFTYICLAFFVLYYYINVAVVSTSILSTLFTLVTVFNQTTLGAVLSALFMPLIILGWISPIVVYLNLYKNKLV